MVSQHQQREIILSRYVNLHLSLCQNMSGVARLEQQSTATYCSIMAKSGEMILGLGDMDIHQQITEEYVSTPDKSNFKWVKALKAKH